MLKSIRTRIGQLARHCGQRHEAQGFCPYCQITTVGKILLSPGMKKSRPYRGFRYPAEIISHDVWLYFRFALSFRDIEELMASSGIIVTCETIRQWTLKFGQGYDNELRRRQPRRRDKWHLDEVVLTIKGKHHYLWSAVDQNGHVLDILMQSRRNRAAAKRFFRKLLKSLRYAPRVLITDKLKSYAAAKVQIMPVAEHRQHKGLNNRAELSHQPTRQRERQMRRFKTSRHALRFLSAHGPMNNIFRCQRNRLTAEQYRQVLTQAFSLWNEVTDVAKNRDLEHCVTRTAVISPRLLQLALPFQQVDSTSTRANAIELVDMAESHAVGATREVPEST